MDEISPKLKQLIRDSLSLSFINQTDAEQYANLAYAISLVKRGAPPWQALVSIGVHAAHLCAFAETAADKAVLREIAGQAREPLEALLKSFEPKLLEEFLDDESARTLFHTRFALGFLLLANGDRQRSRAILHDMAATQLSVRGAEVRSGPGILRDAGDMARVKWATALCLGSEYMCEKHYGDLLYLIAEAAACSLSGQALTDLAGLLLDLWAAECDREDASKQYDFPTLEWLDVFAEAAEILALCQEADSVGTLPSDCKPDSAQFLAWKFGQTVGRFALPDNRWHDDPFGSLSQLLDPAAQEEFRTQRGPGKTSRALEVALSLLCDHDPARDWRKTRQQYVSIWHSSLSYSGMPLPDIGPHTDLYWAMRIGFADKILETSAVPPPPLTIEIAEGTATATSRQIEIQRTLHQILGRLPLSKREIAGSVLQWLSPVAAKLPAKVVNALVKAESYYRTDVNDDDAKVWFCKAVEASLSDCLEEPMVGWMEKQDRKQIAICFPPPRGVERLSPSRIRSLSLKEWADVLDTLAVSHKDLASLGTHEFREFTKTQFGWSRLPDFSPLSSGLHQAQAYRSGSAHHQDAGSRYNKEVWELEETRKLVLGIDVPSVIVQIFQLLCADK